MTQAEVETRALSRLAAQELSSLPRGIGDIRSELIRLGNGPGHRSGGIGESSGLRGGGEQEDVARLDVAVDDPALVGRHQAAGHAGQDRERRRLVEPGPLRQ